MNTAERSVEIALELLNAAPADAVGMIARMSSPDKYEAAKMLEHIAKQAAWLGTYAEERYGYGCGDQGHADAVKSANKAAKTVWCKALGYNGYHDLRVSDPD